MKKSFVLLLVIASLFLAFLIENKPENNANNPCKVITFTRVLSSGKKIEWGTSIVARNNTSVTQSATPTFTRVTSTIINTKNNQEINDLIEQVGLKPELPNNQSTEIEVEKEIIVSPESEVNARVGTTRVFGVAQIIKRNADCSENIIKTYDYDYGIGEAFE